MAAPPVFPQLVLHSQVANAEHGVPPFQQGNILFLPVLRIRIHRIHMFLGLLDPDPDPLVRGMDPDPALDPNPDPSIIMQK